MSPWRLIPWVLGIVGYIALSHWLTLHSAGRPWAIAAFLAPVWVVTFAIAVKQRKRVVVVALLLALPVVALVVARGGIRDVKQLYLIEHVGIHLALFASFVLTLRPGRLSLIGRVAQRVHGTLAPAVAAYTRRVTVTWAIYFAAMALLSVVVYLECDWSVWSLLANVATPVIIVLLFVGEYLLRYRLHPEFDRSTLADALRAYRHTKASTDAPGP